MKNSILKIIVILGVAVALIKSSYSSERVLVLEESTTLSLNDEVNSESVTKVMAQALIMDNALKGDEEITLVLSTPGGSIQAGIELITFINGLKHKVNTLTIFSASMGFQIVQGLNKRLILPYGTLMAHKARGGFQGEFPGQVDSRYSHAIARINQLDEVVVKRTNGKLTNKTYKALYENEYWVDGQKAIDDGLADEVVIARCGESLIGEKNESILFMGFIPVNLVLSKCPLITSPLEIKVGGSPSDADRTKITNELTNSKAKAPLIKF